MPLFTRWWMTTREVLFNPRVFFAAAAQNDDPWPSITYAVMTSVMAGVVLGVIAGVMYMILGSLLVSFFTALFAGRGGSGPPAAAIGSVIGALGFGIAVIYPMLFGMIALVSPFITGGIHHVMLALFGGAARSYTHTVRVSGYNHACYLWLMIPIPMLSPAIAVLFGLVGLVVGLDETHRCGAGRAILSVVSIYGICCVCWCGMQSTLAGFGAGIVP